MNLIREVRYPFLLPKKPHSFFEKLPPESYPHILHSDSREPFFVHIHLPKTGGTTFNTILERNFGESFEQFAGRFIFLLDDFTTSQVKKFMEVQTTIECVASHNFSAVLPYQNAPRKVVAIAFVRNPVDTFFSLYFHLRFRGGDFIQAKNNIHEYVDLKLSGLGSDQNLDGFLTKLTGEESEASFTYITQLVESEHLFLFDTYRMEEACEVLSRNFPDYFTDTDFEIENVSRKDQVVTRELRDRVREKVSLYDTKLLDLANKNLDRLLRSSGLDESRKKCASK